MKMYRGFGACRGIRVPEEDGFAYAAARLEEAEAAGLLAEGITAAELEEWYFSGSFLLEEVPA